LLRLTLVESHQRNKRRGCIVLTNEFGKIVRLGTVFHQNPKLALRYKKAKIKYTTKLKPNNQGLLCGRAHSGK
jgi:hypothetical protein